MVMTNDEFLSKQGDSSAAILSQAIGRSFRPNELGAIASDHKEKLTMHLHTKLSKPSGSFKIFATLSGAPSVRLNNFACHTGLLGNARHTLEMPTVFLESLCEGIWRNRESIDLHKVTVQFRECTPCHLNLGSCSSAEEIFSFLSPIIWQYRDRPFANPDTGKDPEKNRLPSLSLHIGYMILASISGNLSATLVNFFGETGVLKDIGKSPVSETALSRMFKRPNSFVDLAATSHDIYKNRECINLKKVRVKYFNKEPFFVDLSGCGCPDEIRSMLMPPLSQAKPEIIVDDEGLRYPDRKTESVDESVAVGLDVFNKRKFWMNVCDAKGLADYQAKVLSDNLKKVGAERGVEPLVLDHANNTPPKSVLRDYQIASLNYVHSLCQYQNDEASSSLPSGLTTNRPTYKDPLTGEICDEATGIPAADYVDFSGRSIL